MTPWGRAITALRLLRLDPNGLGGVLVHARAGPVRDAFMAQIATHVRLHPALPQESLTGGIDVSQSLTEGTLVRQKGLLETQNETFVLAMAERTAPLMSGLIARCLDQNHGNCLIALDEHLDDEAPPPPAITDRLAFHIPLDGIALSEAILPAKERKITTRYAVSATDADIEAFAALSMQ